MKRRSFIRLSTFTAGAWLLSDILPASQVIAGFVDNTAFKPDPLLKIDESGKVTLFMIKQEMGQNVITALPLLIAEELEVDLKDISVETLPYESSNAGNYTTWASDSIKGNWMHMRKVGATARMMLITAAARQWNVAEDHCKTKNGTVVNLDTGASLSYQVLVKAASSLIPPAKVNLKDSKDFTIIGAKTPKKNLSGILTGKYQYTMDVRLPGMFYAAIVRCPVHHGRVKSWDDSALKGMEGFIRVIQIHKMDDALNKNGLAIVATNTWTALEGQRLLRVTWDIEQSGIMDNEALFRSLETAITSAEPAQVHGKEKGTRFNKIGRPGIYAAQYKMPYLAHATMEPVNCTASYRDGKFEVWGGFQAPMYINGVLPKVFNVGKSDIIVHLLPMGGSFGRKEKIDNVADAMQLARILEAPVQVIYSRIDDIRNDFYRPASLHHLEALSVSDKIMQWRHQLGLTTFPGKEISGPWHTFGGVTNDLCYTVGDYQSAFYPVESPIPLGSWRSISFSANVFAIESFIDELAVNNRIDPVSFRYSLLNTENSIDNLRLTKVLKAATEMIRWNEAPEKGRFRGVACCTYGHAQSHVAHTLEISVTHDKIVKIHRCIAAVDCGLVVDPDGLKAQIEGSLAWALSGAFKNEITVDQGMVNQQSFSDYEVLRMNEMPALEIILIQGGDTPGGGGEPAVPSLGPALCNAIFAATGIRVRDLPISKYGFRLV